MSQADRGDNARQRVAIDSLSGIAITVFPIVRAHSMAMALWLLVLGAGRRLAQGTCRAGGAVWQGKQVMRISISNWSTTEADVDRSAEAILTSYRMVTELAISSGST